MSTIHINGPARLCGEASIQGSKNAVLPMMAGALLHRGITVLTNVPLIRDVTCMSRILTFLGCKVEQNGGELVIDARNVDQTELSPELVSSMRSSVILLGALLGRLGEAKSVYPGGCLIGARPIDLHLKALRDMGVQVEELDETILVLAKDGVSGGRVDLSFPSVGATQQALLAAVLAKGTTVIRNAAREPELLYLCRFLRGMGAEIAGEGTDLLVVHGVSALHDSVFCVPGDRIVAGTYLCAAMATRGEITLRGISPWELCEPLKYLSRSGAKVRRDDEAGEIQLSMKERPLGLTIETAPYPGFPTDLQSPFLAFLCTARGESRIRETIFEDRFGVVSELLKLSAAVCTFGREAWVWGKCSLSGSSVRARDLRGGAALVVAALAAEGQTRIFHCGYVERGYEDICRDLQGLGADIFWEKVPKT